MTAVDLPPLVYAFEHSIVQAIEARPGHELVFSIAVLEPHGHRGQRAYTVQLRFGGIENFDEVARFFDDLPRAGELAGIRYSREKTSRPGRLIFDVVCERILRKLEIRCSSLQVSGPAATTAKPQTGPLRCWVFLALFVCAALGAPAAHACFGTRVTHLDDDRNDTNGTCNLREAIRASNDNAAVDACPAGSSTGTDRVCLPAATYTIDLSTGGAPESALVGDLDITGPLELVGVAADVTRVVGANGISEPLLSIPVTAGNTDNVFIRGVTLEQSSPTGGMLVNSHGAGMDMDVLVVDSVIRGGRGVAGGGIRNLLGEIQIYGSRIEGNRAASNGGGILNDGGIVSLVRSEVLDNETGGDGGGIASTTGGKVSVFKSRIADNRAPSGRGGGFFADTDFDVQYTEFRANRAISGGGFYLASGMGEINRSAFIGNTATATGGGLHA